jgi:hypothetical protein
VIIKNARQKVHFFSAWRFDLSSGWGRVITHGAQDQFNIIQAAVVKHFAVGLCFGFWIGNSCNNRKSFYNFVMNIPCFLNITVIFEGIPVNGFNLEFWDVAI